MLHRQVESSSSRTYGIGVFILGRKYAGPLERSFYRLQTDHSFPYFRTAAMASANRTAPLSLKSRKSAGSVNSTSKIIGLPSCPGTRSTLAYSNSAG